MITAVSGRQRFKTPAFAAAFVIALSLAPLDVRAAHATTGAAPRRAEVERRLAQVDVEASALARQAFEKDPTLEAAEKALRRLEAEQLNQGPRRRLVQEYLAGASESSEARELNEMITANWYYVHLVKALQDPATSGMVRDFFLNASGAKDIGVAQLKGLFAELRDADLKDDERFWHLYSGRMPTAEQALVQNVETRAARSKLPKFVLEHARREGEARACRQLFGGYVARHTPPELAAARRRAAELRAELKVAAQSH